MTNKDWHNTTAWKKARAYAKTILENRCALCQKEVGGDDWTIDHIVAPNGDEPNHDISNLQTLCRRCNSQKQDKAMVRVPWSSPRW
jgi:5-methylcytosine-specific restriction endonuclease McrA